MVTIYHAVFQQIKDRLTNLGVGYESFEHEPVRTSEEAALVRPGYALKQGAKALIVKLYLREGPEKFVMLVVPGDSRFDNKKVKKLFNAKELRFATGEEVSSITNGVQIGGVPPFGSLFGLDTYTDPQVLHNEKIVFNAGDRRVSIALKAGDYLQAENPQVKDLLNSDQAC